MPLDFERSVPLNVLGYLRIVIGQLNVFMSRHEHCGIEGTRHLPCKRCHAMSKNVRPPLLNASLRLRPVVAILSRRVADGPSIDVKEETTLFYSFFEPSFNDLQEHIVDVAITGLAVLGKGLQMGKFLVSSPDATFFYQQFGSGLPPSPAGRGFVRDFLMPFSFGLEKRFCVVSFTDPPASSKISPNIFFFPSG